MRRKLIVNINSYFEKIAEGVQQCYKVAGNARKIGIDPVSEVEVPLANSLAERVVGLVSVLYPQIIDQRIIQRIFELEKQGKGVQIFNAYSSLKLFEIFFKAGENEETQSGAEFEVNLFKAYLNILLWSKAISGILLTENHFASENCQQHYEKSPRSLFDRPAD